MSFFRCNVGKNGNNTQSTKRKNWKNLVIVSGIQFQIFTCQRNCLGDLRKITACSLKTYNILNILNKGSNCCRLEITSCTAWNIVHDDRCLRYCVCYSSIVSNKAFLSCLIIIRSYYQQSVCSVRCSFLRHHDCSLCAVGTCSCDNRNTFVYFINCKFNRLEMLSMCHSCRLTCSTADNDRICTVGNLILEQFFKFIVVHLSVFIHRGNDRYTCTFKNCHLNSSFILL